MFFLWEVPWFAHLSLFFCQLHPLDSGRGPKARSIDLSWVGLCWLVISMLAFVIQIFHAFCWIWIDSVNTRDFHWLHQWVLHGDFRGLWSPCPQVSSSTWWRWFKVFEHALTLVSECNCHVVVVWHYVRLWKTVPPKKLQWHTWKASTRPEDPKSQEGLKIHFNHLKLDGVSTWEQLTNDLPLYCKFVQ